VRIQTAAAVAALALLTASGCASSSGKQAAATPSTSTSSSPASSPSPISTYTAPPPTLPVPGVAVTMSTATAPWAPPALIDNGAHSADYVAAAGLPYGEETTKVHYHAHLDVVIDGAAVPVPAYLGFVAKGKSALGLSALHTHDATGVVHIENAIPATFVLGQVFTEWGVRFSSTCVGGYCTGSGKTLGVFVNGKKYDGDPTRLVLAAHQEIAVMFGTPDQLANPPSSYAFSKGE
jgi:hypothetical protein